MAQPVLIDYKQHSKTLIKTQRGAEYGENVHFIPVIADEVRALALAYPICFLKDNNTGQFGLNVLTGFEAGENLFLQNNDPTDGGPHPDHHFLAPVIVDREEELFFMLNGNDGGIFYTDTAAYPSEVDGAWNFAGFGYNTTQFYNISKRPGKSQYIGGTQDNGTWFASSGAEAHADSHYLRAIGGDGFGCIWHAQDPDMILGSLYYNAFYLSKDGGETFMPLSGIGDRDSNAPFISKLENSPHYPDRVFSVGATGVWRSEDFGQNWEWTYSNTLNSTNYLGNYEEMSLDIYGLARRGREWRGVRLKLE